MKVLSVFLMSLCISWVAHAQGNGEQLSAGTVVIPEKVFTIPELDRERQLRIYLPPGYEHSKETYPVLYMHDAQNLFDAATSYAGEWRVDESLDELAMQTGLKLIVVGIDNGEEYRNRELSPWLNDRIGGAEGKEYMNFLIEEVKPFIDQYYRTKPGQQHTAIMGSSLGGLISHYAIYQYPRIFSRAGIFSPSYWVSDEVFKFTKNHPLSEKHRLYLLMGGKEGKAMNRFFRKMHQLIEKEGTVQFIAKTHPDGEHNEKFWDSEFKTAIKWLFEK